MTPLPEIDQDIRKARTLPGTFLRDPATWDACRRQLFPQSWHVLSPLAGREARGFARPETLLPGALDEPLALVREADGALRLLSNACTHRGHLVVEDAAPARALRCRYHGRRFDLAGRCLGAPGFEDVSDFPGPADALPAASAAEWAGLLFASLRPRHELSELLAAVDRRVGWLTPSSFTFDPTRSLDYALDAPWILYVDNYLEGLHVPHLHGSLARTLQLAGYRSEVDGWMNVQVGIAAEGEPCFDPPEGHPDHGLRVAAWYFFVFPCTMLNVYPWGLSVNVVQPQGPDRMVVRYHAFVRDEALRSRGAGAGLDRVEREDQEVVASAWKGVQARLYDRGRYAPGHEAGVHHFHRQLVRALREWT